MPPLSPLCLSAAIPSLTLFGSAASAPYCSRSHGSPSTAQRPQPHRHRSPPRRPLLLSAHRRQHRRQHRSAASAPYCCISSSRWSQVTGLTAQPLPAACLFQPLVTGHRTHRPAAACCLSLPLLLTVGAQVHKSLAKGDAQPKWMTDQVLAQYSSIWDTEEFRKTAEKNKRNRNSDYGGLGPSLHTAVVNQLWTNGDKTTDVIVIEKILRTMTSKYDFVVCALEEANDLNKMTLDELESSLGVYEKKFIKQANEGEQALKATTDEPQIDQIEVGVEVEVGEILSIKIKKCRILTLKEEDEVVGGLNQPITEINLI
nr:Retrovirus-related Pol polyprotein from transposon TNT 1-94 [Ipomoea batatas]